MSMIRRAVYAVAATLALGPACGAARASDAALAAEWNETVLRTAEAEDGFLTLKGLRSVTLLHIAQHDALSAIHGKFAPYAYEVSAPDADPIAATVEAAFVVATDQYPDQAAEFERIRDRQLSAAPDSAARSRGLAVGAASARAVLAARKGDGWDAEAEYRWHPMAPGVYAEFHEHSGTPQGFIFGAGWAGARGFGFDRADRFRVPPPPEIESAAYATAFEEVKALGRFQSMQRTPDQTHIALWWKDFAENSHNRLARDLVEKEGTSLVDSVRLFALLNMAIFDGYVTSFENKFYYNHWRPYTAIRWADNDGNAATEGEPTWTNTHRHTYAFPSYPSAHGTACASAMTAFADVFGDDTAFTMRIAEVDVAGPFSGKIEMHPPVRSFRSFSEAATECGLSRVYLGIHFRYDSVVGVELGKTVGNNLVDNVLLPVPRGQ